MNAPSEIQTRYDAVVLGAGPSGSTAAATLARQSLSVLIAEEQDAIPFKVGESIPGIASSVIARAGFPDVLSRVDKVRCSGNRSCWGSPELRLRPGLLNPYGGGVHLDRAQFDQQLLQESVAAGAEVLHGARFHRGERSEGGWTLFLRRGANLCSVECDSVVDCTGRSASFARTQGATRIVVDKQIAIVSVLSGDNVTDNDLTTTIETTRDGWWYSAPVPNRKRIVVFFSDGDLLAKLEARSSEGFARLMRQSRHIRECLAEGYSVGRKPAVVLADTSYLTSSAGDGWCAAGDAAAALDPLASAGIMDAVNSGARAARLVLSGFRDIEDYRRMVLDRAKANIDRRRSYYLMELQWPRASFWARRHKSQSSRA